MFKNLSFVILMSLMLAGCISRGPDLTLYVSPDGSDKNCGSMELPFASLARARDAAREAGKNGALSNGVEIVIADGRYSLSEQLKFDAQDSGFVGGPVVYRADDGAQVSVNGSTRIPFSAFKAVKDPAVLKRLDSAAQSQVLSVDLSALGFRKISRPRVVLRLPFNVPELFVDNERMTLARWPNEGWATIKKIVFKGTQNNTGSVSDSADPNKKRPTEKKGGIFTYEGDRPARWNLEHGVWLHGFWCFDWYDDAIQVSKIDTAKNEF